MQTDISQYSLQFKYILVNNGQYKDYSEMLNRMFV